MPGPAHRRRRGTTRGNHRLGRRPQRAPDRRQLAVHHRRCTHQTAQTVPGNSNLTLYYYRQHGVGGPESSQIASTMLGGFVKTEAMAHGIQSGLRFLSLIVGGVGLLVTALLAWSAVARSA